jgi:phosphatidylserine/phosphatidylglycerophosphate/cardiolipin synthase-like enzyme
MSPVHTALMLDAIAQAREVRSGQMLFDLVLSGPEVPGVPTADTAATVQTLIEGAQREVLLVGYAVHNGKRLFKRLAERMEAVPDLRVVFCLDIARKPADTSLESEIVWRFAREFVTKHWPGKRFPEVFYDPRGLAETWEGRASLHAKCVIVDRYAALVTSANFTAAAQKKNIEVGVLIRHEATVDRLTGYFEAGVATGWTPARVLSRVTAHLSRVDSPDIPIGGVGLAVFLRQACVRN